MVQSKKELPDFYNILLERPKNDPDGYDVIYVEAAFCVSEGSVGRAGSKMIATSRYEICEIFNGIRAGSNVKPTSLREKEPLSC